MTKNHKLIMHIAAGNGADLIKKTGNFISKITVEILFFFNF